MGGLNGFETLRDEKRASLELFLAFRPEIAYFDPKSEDFGDFTRILGMFFHMLKSLNAFWIVEARGWIEVIQ